MKAEIAGGIAVFRLQLDKGVVDEKEVVIVDDVLGLEFPVAGIAADEGFRAQHDLAAGREVEAAVEQDLGPPEMIEERRHVRIEAGKDKAAIAFDARQAEQSLRLREGVGIAAGLAAMGDADQRPVIGIDPAVIGALEFPRPAGELPAQHRAAMPAAIDQHMEPALLVAADDHRLQADMRGLEVARLGQLALMRDEDPGLLEDALHLAREDGGIA